MRIRQNKAIYLAFWVIILIAFHLATIHAQDDFFFDMDERFSDHPPSFLDHLTPAPLKETIQLSGMAEIPVRKFRIQGNALFSGYDNEMRAILAMYQITKNTIQQCQQQGIPSNVISAMEKLIDKPFLNSNQLMQAIKPLMNENDKSLYANVIQDHASLYKNNRISPEHLHDVKRRLTQYYQKRGYINSIAVIPDQEVIDGVITIRVVEGRLTGIELFGNKNVSKSYIFKRIHPLMDQKNRILNIFSLEKKLQAYIPLLKQNPRIDNVNIRLMPGISMGEANLEIHVKETRMMQVKLNANNHHSPGIGAYCGEIGLRHLNLFGLGDTIHLQYGMTEGLDDIAFNYKLPVNTYGAYITLTADQSESVVVTDDYKQFDLTNKVIRYSMGLTWPFVRNLFHEFSMTVRMERLHSETTFMDLPFALGGADENGEADLSIAHCIHEWIHRSKQQVFGIRSTASFGLDAFDATINETGPDGRFSTWLIQTQWLRHLNFWDSQIITRLDVRYSDEHLMSSQKFALGGANTVRGYRENRITSDDGQLFSFQWQFPIMRFPWKGLSKKSDEGHLIASCFYDYGNAHNVDTSDPKPNSISSIGLGLRWNITRTFFAEINWANALRDLEPPEQYDIQDDGIHFQIQMLAY